MAVSLVEAARHTVSVVVVRRLVPPWTAVATADVALEQLPAAALPARGVLRRPAAVVGRYTREGLVPGEVVTEDALTGGVPAETAYDLRLARLTHTSSCTPAPPVTALPPPGSVIAHACPNLVAVSLPLDADQGYELVRTGDRVDVAATYTLQSGTVSQVVVADVPVLARVDGSGSPSLAYPTAGGTSGWLVLAVPPTQALRLELAASAGRLDIFLCAPGVPPAVQERVQQDVVTTTELVGTTSQVPPVEAGQLP
jgi:hypothetical protein